MGASALAVLGAIAYEGAGTVEFLLDGAGRHHFMEMNTRLQVEHPVTEAITGLDLVEWQFRVAAGEPLPLGPAGVHFAGHAIEVRLCAEDPQHGFLPQSGTLALWQPPAGLRVEHALASGAAISPDFDSMIAKLVAHGPDRDTARRRLAAGLRDLVALGVVTNREYLARCLDDPVFAAGGATTAFAEERAAALRAPGDAVEAGLLAVAALVLFVCPAGAAEPGVADDDASNAAHPLAHRLPVPMRLAVAGGTVAATVTRLDAARVAVDVGGTRTVFDGLARRAHDLHFRRDGVAGRATFVRDAHGAWLQVQGRSLRVDDSSLAAPARAAGGAADGKLRAAMAGRVVALLARTGDRVEAGTPLVTLEAMKMEHAHAAPRAGVVAAIHVAPGDQVAAGHVVAEVV
jgi:geranyl-CoA carboxylase alpha subunit